MESLRILIKLYIFDDINMFDICIIFCTEVMIFNRHTTCCGDYKLIYVPMFYFYTFNM